MSFLSELKAFAKDTGTSKILDELLERDQPRLTSHIPNYKPCNNELHFANTRKKNRNKNKMARKARRANKA
jgi:hypothetical protein